MGDEHTHIAFFLPPSLHMQSISVCFLRARVFVRVGHEGLGVSYSRVLRPLILLFFASWAWLSKVRALFEKGRSSSSPWLHSDTHKVVQLHLVRTDTDNKRIWLRAAHIIRLKTASVC